MKLERKDNEKNIYIMFNKPAGYVCARKDDKDPTIFELIPDELKTNYTLFPVGRLDKDTEGILLLTNDGMFNHKVIHGHSNVTKTYYFWALGNLEESFIEDFKLGVQIDDTDEKHSRLTKPAFVDVTRKGTYESLNEELSKFPLRMHRVQRNSQDVFEGTITVSEGRKHEVKRLLKYAKCYIIYLKRLAIGNLKLDDNLKLGECKILSQEEINKLFE